MLLGYDANDVNAPGNPTPPYDDRHEGVFAPHPLDHVEGDLIVADDRVVPAGDVPKGHWRVSSLKTAPQAGVDANDAVNSALLGHHDVTKPALCFMLAQKRVEARLGRKDQHIGIHDFASMAHEEHVGMKRLGD